MLGRMMPIAEPPDVEGPAVFGVVGLDALGSSAGLTGPTLKLAGLAGALGLPLSCDALRVAGGVALLSLNMGSSSGVLVAADAGHRGHGSSQAAAERWCSSAAREACAWSAAK